MRPGASLVRREACRSGGLDAARSASSWRGAALAFALLCALTTLLGLAPRPAEAQGGEGFNHMTTQFPLTGRHLLVPCEQCHQHGIFKGTSKLCSTCHTAGNQMSAVVRPQNHIPTTESCDMCHTTATFQGAHFDHIGVAPDSCVTCHNNVYQQGAPTDPIHILNAGVACSTCHTTVSFTTVSMPPGHMPDPAGTACNVCHTTPSNYAVYTMGATGHAGITSGCTLCHETGSSFLNMAPPTLVTRPTAATDPNHPTAGDCSNCHAGFLSFGNGVMALPSGHIPNPAGTACNVCHTNPSDYSVYSMGSTGHSGITSGCTLCHEAGRSFLNMAPPTLVERPTATQDPLHPATGDCATCHSGFAPGAFNNVATLPAGHLPTTAACTQCHTTPGNYAVYSVAGVHQGVTGCLSCHGPGVAGGFLNIKITTTPSNHIPIGGLDCNGSGCHSTSNLNPGGFQIGTASINAPTLSVTGHTTIASAVAGCQTCHETAPYLGMVPSTASAAGDSRPTALDAYHPTAGDCGTCHTTIPTFASNETGSLKPANHIPTTAACSQCHSNPSNYAIYSVTGVHVGVTSCLTCHAPAVANTFANVTIVSTPSNHIPIGSLDCSGSGCHSTSNVNPGGFQIGTASINSPTLSIAGHTTVTAVIGACEICHETAPYLGMIPSTASAAGDSRPLALDAAHPTTGDCTSCHTTTPTFGSNVTATKPSNHIPTTAPCTQCHTSPGNYLVYSVTGVHQGVTTCAICHGPSVANTFANINITTTPGDHIPIGSVDCNGSGCHSTANVNPGGFLIGVANVNSPTLTVTGHTTVAASVSGCTTCHENAAYLGMIPSTAGAAGDSRPPNTLDAAHPTTGDCGSCHTTTPTFTTNQTGGATKPSNHIPTTAACSQCHTTGDYALYSVTGVHVGVTGCLTCHAPSVANTFANIAITSTPSNHIPISTLDCNGSGCHSTANVNPGGFFIGVANISSPTLNVTGHTTAAAAGSCSSCHDAGTVFLGMIASTASAGDTRPTATLDPAHPTTGDCAGCHTTTPTFATDLTGTVAKPSNHIPTTAACIQCHTTAGVYTTYSATGVHQGVASCAVCHGPTVAATYNAGGINIVTTPSNHIPIGSVDCGGSGCHTTSNVTYGGGGFVIGAASINTPTLTTTGHTTVSAGVAGCSTCHETAPYLGMIASTSTAAGDSRPNATLDSGHPTTGDCGNCHTTTPTFLANKTAQKPSNHIPTTAACSQCHTNLNDFSIYSVTGTHVGVTNCAICHGPSVAGTFANIKIVTTPSNHIPIGSVDCGGSGCHTTSNVNPGGFLIGAASINSPTLNVTGHSTVAAGVAGCSTCHETAPYLGMIASTASVAGDSRPSSTLDANHPTTGDCSGCHSTTPTFTTNQSGGTSKPSNHIPTTAACSQCHTTSNYAQYSVTGTHIGVTSCLTCHAPAVANTFANITIVSTPSNHIPIGSLDCSGSGCHSTSNVNPGGFLIGTANINSPSLSIAGHTTVLPAVGTCQTCHETAPYLGMVASTATTAGDSRPTTLDPAHPTTGDCSSCHTTTPTFGANVAATKPSNHIPTTAACTQCHTTAGNYAIYSVTGTHVGVTGCLACHASNVANTFANITIVSTPSNHIPIGTLDCNGSGCHTMNNLNSGGFLIGAANINSPTLNATGHATVAPAVTACSTCHETAPYLGMVASTGSAAGDSRPNATLDSAHPTSGDCSGCHSTAPTFGTNQTGGSAKPSNHIPTTAACSQCHTTAGNYALYSVTGTHVGVTGCLACHASAVASTFANIKIVSTPTNHIPVGTLDCNGSGCHSTANVNPGGFLIGAANINTPTLNTNGHTTVAAAVTGCTACHETAPYLGMVASTNTTIGDSRPNTTLDKSHPTTGECNGCHTTTPTFAGNVTAGSKPSNHIPTSQPCTLCHTTAGNFAAYVMGTVGHTGIVSNCAQCHSPTGSAMYNAGGLVITTTPVGPPAHIPVTGMPCEGCHSITNFTTFSGTTMVHTALVIALTCETCHEYGDRWYGVNIVDRPSPSHHAGEDCKPCHQPGTTFNNARKIAPFKPAPKTSAPISGTGTTSTTGTTSGTTSTTPTTGSGTTSGSTTGSRTPSKGITPPPTVLPMPAGPLVKPATATGINGFGATPSFGAGSFGGQLGPNGQLLPGNARGLARPMAGAGMPMQRGMPFNHIGVLPGACMTCHNGRTAQAKPANHLLTNLSCDTCHRTTAWIPATFTHVGVVPGSCATCHNGRGAKGKPASHFVTARSCDTCHRTTAWRPIMPYLHLSPAYKQHAISVTCVKCHRTNNEVVPMKFAAFKPYCAACHADAFRPALHKKVEQPPIYYTVQELKDCSGSCHLYTDARALIVKQARTGRHRPTSGGF